MGLPGWQASVLPSVPRPHGAGLPTFLPISFSRGHAELTSSGKPSAVAQRSGWLPFSAHGYPWAVLKWGFMRAGPWHLLVWGVYLFPWLAPSNCSRECLLSKTEPKDLSVEGLGDEIRTSVPLRKVDAGGGPACWRDQPLCLVASASAGRNRGPACASSGFFRDSLNERRACSLQGDPCALKLTVQRPQETRFLLKRSINRCHDATSHQWQMASKGWFEERWPFAADLVPTFRNPPEHLPFVIRGAETLSKQDLPLYKKPLNGAAGAATSAFPPSWPRHAAF